MKRLLIVSLSAAVRIATLAGYAEASENQDTPNRPTVGAQKAADETFEDTAKTYRDAAVKPVLPEEARRFAVQAQAAIRDNDFRSAADRFKQALEIAPWWPEGHYQRAILLSGINDFSGAIVEMKRYLVLVPDAANARQAQDKVYEWEVAKPPQASTTAKKSAKKPPPTAAY